MPEDFFLYALGAAVLAALITNLMVSPTVRLAVALRALDTPDSRKQHDQAVPRLGGVAIVTGLVLGAGAIAVAQWRGWGNPLHRAELLALAAGTALVFLIGVIDDLAGVSAPKKLLVELVAAWILVRVGWSFEVLRLPLLGEIDLGLWGTAVSLLWIVGVTNAINLIDGLDGLAGGVVAIISTSLLVYSILQGNPGTVILMAGTAGACLGFLRHNWEPARVFMGDSGSLTLGFLLAAVSVHSALKAPAAVAILVPILALGVPVMDTLLVMVVRFLGRSQQAGWAGRFLRMFRADRLHLHHLLVHFGGKRSRIVAALYGLVFSFCALALIVAITGELSLGIALLAFEFLVILAIRQMGMAMDARRIARSHTDQIKQDLLQTNDEPPDNVRRFLPRSDRRP
jgi:UDP-GlcNAc:undecaprenyl-phosphate GlcNAc-1-phosphate transferase